MISDPYAPGFRQPSRGERYYHRHWKKWCTVQARSSIDPALLPDDETPVHFDDDQLAIVKLKSLETSAP